MSNLPEQGSAELLRRISEIFKDGSSRTSWLGRNFPEMRLAITLQAHLSQKKKADVLVLGSGLTDGWESATVLEANSLEGQIIALDRDPEIFQLNQKLKTSGELAVSETLNVLRNPAVGLKAVRKDVTQPDSLLKRFSVTGISVEDDLIKIDDRLKRRVANVCEDAGSFLKKMQESNQRFDVIISNNLLNNLIFQGFNYERMMQLFTIIRQRLNPDGVFEFVHNDEFFHCFEENDPKNLLEILEAAGFDILLKTTTYVDVIDHIDGQVINENASFIVAPRESRKNLENTDTLIKKIRSNLSQCAPEITFIEARGSLSEFTTLLGTGTQTKIVFLNLGNSEYYWFNIEGRYAQVFSNLAKRSFYPDIMQALTEN